MKRTLLFLLLLICSSLSAQQWVNCTSGHYVIDIVQQDEILWVATTGGLVKHNTVDGSSQVFNRGNRFLKGNC